MKYLLLFVAAITYFSLFATEVAAVVDPRESENNKFGIHITNASDIEAAARLVNSSGGDWGYVTLVIRDDERDVENWQELFDLLREKRLIPIVRLATRAEGEVWVKPKETDIDAWVTFLSQLNWVVKNRYIVLFNEPNHAKEWGGDINPAEYAQITREFHAALKENSEDYFILPAGMDDAAPDGSATMSGARFFKEMFEADDQIFTLFDGWTSHSYPNPAFSAKPTDVGPGSVRGFEAELRLVKQFGFDDTKPVFITETGWVHSEGSDKNSKYSSPEQVGENLRYGFERVWNGDNVVAVTPFILDYPEPPFDHFSWKKKGEDVYLPQYAMIQEIPKTAGKPAQGHESVFNRSYLPATLESGRGYTFAVEFTNTGQSIWEAEKFSLIVETDIVEAIIEPDVLKSTKPGETAVIFVDIYTPELNGDYFMKFQLAHDEQVFGVKGVVNIVLEKNLGLMGQVKLWLQQLRYPDEFMISLVWPNKFDSLRS